MKTFIIPGNTPSSKNGRVWTGRYSVASAATRKWKLATDEHWKSQAKQFRKESKGLTKPLYIEFKFYRKSTHKFDLINIPQDDKVRINRNSKSIFIFINILNVGI